MPTGLVSQKVDATGITLAFRSGKTVAVLIANAPSISRSTTAKLTSWLTTQLTNAAIPCQWGVYVYSVSPISVGFITSDNPIDPNWWQT